MNKGEIGYGVENDKWMKGEWKWRLGAEAQIMEWKECTWRRDGYFGVDGSENNEEGDELYSIKR